MLLARRIGLVLAAVASVFGASVFTRAPGTSAQESTTSVPSAPRLPVGLSLVSQTTWVPLRETFTMKLHIDDPALAATPGAAIAIRIHQSTTSRSGFDEVIANQNLFGINFDRFTHSNSTVFKIPKTLLTSLPSIRPGP